MKGHNLLFHAMCACALLLSACAGGDTQSAIETGIAQTQEVSALQTEAAAGGEGEEARPEVDHLTSPGEPPARNALLVDIDTSVGANTSQALAGDAFADNRYERPFTPETMDYRPDLDIIRAESASDGEWLYFSIEVFGPHPQSGDFPGTYAVEIDLDTDGDGDWLLLVAGPLAGEWRDAGVRAYFDANDDAGGQRPGRSDASSQAGDGYEQEVYNQGLGADPDAAWGRAALEDANTIQIAVKRALLDNDPAFLWSAWADGGGLLPTQLDLNDHFTLAEAGSPAASSADYPLKAVALIDNTCRVNVGFEPSGSERNLCTAAAPNEPTAQATSETGLPDLVCLNMTHEGVYDFDEHTFTYTIANQGQAPVAAGYNTIFRVIYSDNSTGSAGPFPGPALAPGDTYTGEYTFDILPAGNNQISFVLDAVEALEESNEGNNQCVLNINVVEGNG